MFIAIPGLFSLVDGRPPSSVFVSNPGHLKSNHLVNTDTVPRETFSKKLTVSHTVRLFVRRRSPGMDIVV